MKKIILFIVLLCMVMAVSGIKECDSPIEQNDIPCNIISTYPLAPCNAYTVTIYNATPEAVYVANYGDYGTTGRCNVTFNITKGGSYTINSSDGSSAMIQVDEKMASYYLYGVTIFLFIVFFGLGYYLQQSIFTILSGMLLCITALSIFNNGFPNFTNIFLINSIVAVLAGIGFYLILVPSIEYFQTIQ